MIDDVLNAFSPTQAGRLSRAAYGVRLFAFALLVGAGVLVFLEQRLDAYVAWVTMRDIQVTLVAGLKEWIGLALALALALWAFSLLVGAVVGRLHDLGYHGIGALFLLIPGLNVLLVLLLVLWPGREAANRFGAPAPGASEAGAPYGAPVEAVRDDALGLPPAAARLMAGYRADAAGENLTVRLQLKNRLLTKLSALVTSGELTAAEYERLKVHVLNDEVGA